METNELIDKLIKDFKKQKVKNPEEMPYVSAVQYNKIMDTFIGYLKSLKNTKS